MHELPATQGILDTALQTARAHGSRRVLAIDLVIGDLSSMVDDSVQMYFDVLSRGTLAHGAELRFRREPGAATCFDCAARYPVRPPLAPTCPICGGTFVRVSGGQQFTIESIEVEDEGPRSH
jgi:hydrogenase nickel incorporation protein HypA/HybF